MRSNRNVSYSHPIINEEALGDNVKNEKSIFGIRLIGPSQMSHYAICKLVS